jgi:hypothetical protein
MDNRKQAKTKREQAYHKQMYDRLCYMSRKVDRYPERIRTAARIYNISPTQYALKAIDKQLQLDGITVDSLPDRAEAESVKHD